MSLPEADADLLRHRSAVTPEPDSSRPASNKSSPTPSSPTAAGPPYRSPVAPNRPLPPAPDADGLSTGVQLPTGSLQTPKKGDIRAAGGDRQTNPFDVDLVIPFSVAEAKGTQNVAEVSVAYERLISALEGEGGLRVTARPGRGGKGAEEVWVFVSATNGKVAELVARERIIDQAHGMQNRATPNVTTTPATRLRLLYELLTSPDIQGGLGITPGEGEWKRVKAIVALHDDEKDAEWVHSWTVGGDWKIGLLSGLGDQNGEMLGENQTPEVRLYFNFLTTYTLSLLPLTVIASAVWFFTPADSYTPALGFVFSFYACAFIAIWRIRERKLAVRWGTRGCENVAGQLRPQYVTAHNVRDSTQRQHRTELIRDFKVALSVPVILSCGAVLVCVLTFIFMLEAFVGHLWSGPGKAVVPFIPMALFSLVVPQVVAIFSALSRRLVDWEDHPTVTGANKSLTAKTFAMNTIVAYMGLFLTAYVYLPFGPYIMAYVHTLLNGGNVDAKGAAPHSHHERINIGRLKGQMFAYMVTNQVINTFLELGLPFILRIVEDVRSGKSIKEAIKGGPDEKARGNSPQDAETRFLDKVAHELTLPAYNVFTDYAEMVTQFGYVVVWGLVWPLAPAFALINNYFELRGDAIKICKHVRRPIGARVESIGTWLDTLGVIAWVGSWASTTLIYLFRPRATFLGTCNATLAAKLAAYDACPTAQTVLPHVVPVILAALAASHGFFALRAVVTAVTERVFWRGSPEQLAVDGALLSPDTQNQVRAAIVHERSEFASHEKVVDTGFWNGTAQGEAEILRVGKSE